VGDDGTQGYRVQDLTFELSRRQTQSGNMGNSGAFGVRLERKVRRVGAPRQGSGCSLDCEVAVGARLRPMCAEWVNGLLRLRAAGAKYDDVGAAGPGLLANPAMPGCAGAREWIACVLAQRVARREQPNRGLGNVSCASEEVTRVHRRTAGVQGGRRGRVPKRPATQVYEDRVLERSGAFPSPPPRPGLTFELSRWVLREPAKQATEKIIRLERKVRSRGDGEQGQCARLVGVGTRVFRPVVGAQQ